MDEQVENGSAMPPHNKNLPYRYDSRDTLLSTDTSGTKTPQYVAGLTATFSVFTMGTALAWTSQISQDLRDGALGFPITTDELGWIGSLMALGAAVLSLFAGSLCDLLGRKTNMLAMVLPIVAGWSLIIWATRVEMVYCGRFLTGMVAGAYCVSASIYNSEIAQKEIRGALGSYTQMMISSGILFANVVAKFLSVRAFTVTCALIPIIFGLAFLFMPETPYYLVKNKKIGQARQVLRRLRGKFYDVEQEIKEIETSLWEKQMSSGWETAKKSWSKSSTKKACAIGTILMIFKTINGVDAVTAYTAYIFENANIGIDPQVGTIILNAFQVATAIVQSMVVDRSGRRILLICSASIMSVCLVVVGLVLTLKQRHILDPEYFAYVNLFPFLALIIFMVAFSLGLGPIPWLMMGEIFPQEIKTYAASGATFVSKVSTFGVTKTFLIIDSDLGGDVAFYIFALITACSIVFSIFFVPETKNKTFDEIQESLK